MSSVVINKMQASLKLHGITQTSPVTVKAVWLNLSLSHPHKEKIVFNQLGQDYICLLCSAVISHEVTEASANALSMVSVRKSN